jgi:hypothetical protein
MIAGIGEPKATYKYHVFLVECNAHQNVAVLGFPEPAF